MRRLKLIVDDSGARDDNSVVALTPARLDELNLIPGDIVTIKSLARKETVCIVLEDTRIQNGRIRMSTCTRTNLCVESGDPITIQPCRDIRRAKRVRILPIADSIPSPPQCLSANYLRPYFNEADRPVHVNDLFTVRLNRKFVKFRVVATDPSPYCIVVSSTVIDWEGEPLEPSNDGECVDLVSCSDVGGYWEQVAEVKRLVGFPFNGTDSFSNMGVKPPQGIILHGPPGTGKTLIARAVINESWLPSFYINGHDIMSKSANIGAAKIGRVFSDALKNTPSIVLIDELDAIAPNTGSVGANLYCDTERRYESSLMAAMEEIRQRSSFVMVIATTSRLCRVHPDLRRYGRFDYEIGIGIPSSSERLAILGVSTKDMPLSSDVDLEKIANGTIEFVGADIEAVCRDAVSQSIKETLNQISRDNPDHDCVLDVDLGSSSVSMANFDTALRRVLPSTKRC